MNWPWNMYMFFTECAKHCSLCYNETECYECTQGFFLTLSGECERKCSLNVMMILQNAMKNNLLWKWMKYILIINSKYITNVIEGRPISLTKMSIKIVLRFITMQIWSKSQSLLFCISECAKHCSLCYNETECYECTQGFFLDENGECKRKFSTKFD